MWNRETVKENATEGKCVKGTAEEGRNRIRSGGNEKECDEVVMVVAAADGSGRR